MQGQFQINEQSFEVETNGSGDSIEVNVGGQTFQIQLTPSETGFVASLQGMELQLSLEEVQQLPLRNGELQSLSVDGASMDVQFTRARRVQESTTMTAMGAEGDENSITAFMPGTIVRIDVEEGQEVKQGEVLLILEAMKMENEIKAARDCTVEMIHTSTGANVNKGELLLQLSD